jgi:transposase
LDEILHQQEANPMAKKLRVLGIDIAKQVFHLVGRDEHGTMQLRKRLARAQVMTFIAQLPPTLIGMEACRGAHYWARRMREHGHAVKWMAPQCVTPDRKAHKNDRQDAEAIAEAVPRPTMRLVPVKAVDQQDLQALHRVRERLMKARTALINETRGLLHAYGIIVPQGAATFRTHVQEKVATEETKLTAHSRALFQQLLEELAALDARIATYDAQWAQVAQAHPVCQRLMTIPGLGELTATALVAAVSDATQCKNGRQCAAWLGLVPRQHSTGGKPRLLGISKHGDRYLRTLLVHGARSCLRGVGRKCDRRSHGIRSLIERRGWNRAAVALANKHARVAWVLLSTEQVYRTAAA